MSFADATKPKGTQFLGACVVEAANVASAVLVSHQNKCNPGGEIRIWEFEQDRCPIPIVAIENKLMSKDDIDKLFPND